MEKKTEKEGPKMVAPEGGYGWVVAFGCLLITMMLSIPTLAFGILLKDMIRVLGVTNAEASWTISIQLGMSQIISPISTMSINIFSCRKTAFVGGITVAAGLILSYFAKSITVLYMTFGFLTGVGIGLARIPSLVVGSQYFPTTYSIVAGITFAGFSIGRFVFSPVTEKIKEEFGYESTYLLIGGICLNILVGATLFQPVKRFLVPEKPAETKEKKKKKLESKNQAKPISQTKSLQELGPEEKGKENQYVTLPNSGFKNGYMEMKPMSNNGTTQQEKVASEARYSTINETDANSNAPIFNPLYGVSSRDSINNLKELIKTSESKTAVEIKKPLSKTEIMKNTLKKSLDLTLLKEPIFYVICASSILSYLTVLYSNVYLVPLGKEKGISPMDASLVFSAKAGAEIAGRLGFPFIQKFVKMDVILFYIIICSSVALCLLGQALVTGFIPFLIFGILTGFITGGTVVISVAVMLKSVGVKRYSSSIGLTCFIQGWFALFGGPLVGFVRDLTGNFVVCYMLIMSLQIASILLWLSRYSYVRWCAGPEQESGPTKR